MEQSRNWRRLNGTPVKRTIEEEVREAIISEMNAGHHLKLCIGTDSQVKGDVTEFATVILFVRKGRGGFMYSNKDIRPRRIGIRERMQIEVAKSVETAYALQILAAEYNVAMEVHADINTNPAFKSYDSLKEALGFITGMGFEVKAKPEAFASSCCANRVVQ